MIAPRPPEPPIIAVDAGGATTAVALIGRLGGRRRLLASATYPAGLAEADLVARLATAVAARDPGLAADLGINAGSAPGWPCWRVATSPPPTLAVLAGSPRALQIARRSVDGTGWRIAAATPESHDPREVTALLLRPDITAVVLVAGDPPGADERSSVTDLTALVAAVRQRRPGLPVVLCGAMAGQRRRFDRLGLDDEEAAAVVTVVATRGDPRAPIRRALEHLRAPGGDGRQRIADGTAALASVLGRRVEVIDIGLDGGLRAIAAPNVGDPGATVHAVASAEAALVPPEPDAAAVEQLGAWLSGAADRVRALDHLSELRLAPWSDATGSGARLRLAAAAAALERLVACSDEISAEPLADLLVLVGGGFSAGPPAAVALTVADVLRRPGATQVALDHARLLGPIGTIDDPSERRQAAADLADDLLLPLGSVVILDPDRGLPRTASAWVDLVAGEHELPFEVARGTVEQVDLPPGTSGVAAVAWRAGGDRARSTRRTAMPVSGGLAGLIVDARGVPLPLPARGGGRRGALAAWHDPLWSAAP